MEKYVVSARKYRPQLFSEVVGQKNLTETLKNSIVEGRLAHAYLFCGPRGVGKTTCARIFAKAINCEHRTPDGEPCNNCESCRTFNENRSLNIHELDAASNNSVDDIRQLIEEVRIPPQSGRYKVFIIDEVHMLSPAAANAFLKTLEEPPAHVVFILATTEKQKILATILSRCQIYDFNRMSVPDTVAHLRQVCQNEGYEAEDAALDIIAQKADGGMRDALSILDQVANFTKGHLTYQEVIKNLNVLDYDYYFKLTDAFLRHDTLQPLLLFNEILEKGFDQLNFINGLARHFRNLMVAADKATLPLLEVSESVRNRYVEQAARVSMKLAISALRLCNQCSLTYRTSSNKRLFVELTLIEIAQLTSDGEDADPAGRGPNSQLKPIFSDKGASKPQTPRAADKAAPAANKVSEPEGRFAAPASAHAAPTLGNGASAAASYGQKASQGGYSKYAMPSFSDILSGMGQKESTPAQPTAPQGNTENAAAAGKDNTAGVETDMPIDPQSVNLELYRFANQLPPQDKSIAARMKLVKLDSIDDETYKMTLESDLVKKTLEPYLPKLEAFVRKNLKNRKFRLQVYIKPPEERTVILSPRQQMLELEKSNSAFAILKSGLNLELA